MIVNSNIIRLKTYIAMTLSEVGKTIITRPGLHTATQCLLLLIWMPDNICHTLQSVDICLSWF